MLRLEFSRFSIYPCNSDTVTCPCDAVKILEGDGTTLMERGCGYSSTNPSHSQYFLPPILTTKANTVDIFFYTDSSTGASGWSLSWTAVTPGPTQNGAKLCLSQAQKFKDFFKHFFCNEIIKKSSNSHLPIGEAYMHRRLSEVHLSPTNFESSLQPFFAFSVTTMCRISCFRWDGVLKQPFRCSHLNLVKEYLSPVCHL